MTDAPDETVGVLRAAAQPLPTLPDDPGSDPDWAAPFDRFGAARVVLLGEATHGTSEFYRARAAITRRLVERHGFTIVALEADWPDAAHLDAYARHRAPRAEEEAAFTRFPAWMWRNAEMRGFLDWLRAHNAEQPAGRRVEIRGLDVYSLRRSIRAVLTYLDEVDPEGARAARERYGCLTPWQSDPVRYGSAVLHGRDPCEDKVAEQLQALLHHRLDYAARDGAEAFFDAAQNARIVRAAEQYYRIMYRGSTESWNLRDQHMFDTLDAVIQARGPDAKAVVWAHNSHLGDARATSMGWGGEFNVGQLCRVAWRDGAALVGFGTDRGTVAAATEWGEEVEIKQVRPAMAGSHEALFREAGLPASLTDLRRPELRDALLQPRLQRAIGVIYRPETERFSHYFDAVLPEQFDAYAWFAETRAVTPIAVRGEAEVGGVPDTYPFGT